MSGGITEVMSHLALQLGVIIFAVRVFGGLAKKAGIPSVLGELVAGIIIGPYALGKIAFPGFSEGLFPVASGSLSVSPELYSIATIASIILLFSSGLETDFALFLRYSLKGSIVGLGGVVFSFSAGAFAAAALLHIPVTDPRCLFFGIMSTATSVGITARILSDQKKMDSPEGVTTLAAAVFDDVLGIILLAIVLGIVSALSGGGGLSASGIALIAAKALVIWLGFTVLGLVFSEKIAGFLKLFKHSHDFSICALGLALILAGFFEMQGLAMIIGAYVTGLSLSGTDIANIIEERIHALYEFFVPIFFAVMGMLVNIGQMLSREVLLMGLIYTGTAILAKVLGCGLPTLFMGFNSKGALRIGTGMVPRGEVALIIAGIGITAGILNEQLFGVVVMMTLLTTLVAPPLLSFSLKIPGRGTVAETKSITHATLHWNFSSNEIADIMMDTLIKDMRTEGFFVQMMNRNAGLSQARKGDISLSITEEGSTISIGTSTEHTGIAKTFIYEAVLKIHNAVNQLKDSIDTRSLKKESAEADVRPDASTFKKMTADLISIDLQADTKDEILQELVTLLAKSESVTDAERVLRDVKDRESLMSTGMQNGIAIPHAKSDGVTDLTIAVGIKKGGINFDSLDAEKSKLFVLIVSPHQGKIPHLQVLAMFASILHRAETRQNLIDATNAEDVLTIIKEAKLRH
ncbi:MAG: cation:proton antiporter [Treponemataceae bacterium]|nr:MAG: cation:proton antiporter [Treponemataceae bacterium]